MSIFKIKKIISFSFLILFLISFALPFSVALAQDTQKADFYYTVVGLLDNKEHQLGPYTFLDCSQKLSDAKKNKLVTVKSVFCFEAKNGTGTQVTNITTNSNGSITSTTESVTVPTTTPSIVPESNYYPLAPLPGVGETCTQDKSTPPKTICIKTAATCTGGNCTPGIGFAGYLNVMINLFIGICAVLAMIMIIMGGIQYMTSELISGKEAGKEQVTHAVLGLLLALGAYAILNTINPDLLNIGLNKLPTASITVQSSDTAQSPPANGQAYPYTTYKQGDVWPSDKTTRDALNGIKGGNVVVNAPPCTKVGNFGCTSVYQLNTAFVTKLNNECTNCKLTITEGTAFWAHSANNLKVHYPGGFSVDLSETPTLKSELSSNWQKTHFDKWFQNKGADCYYKNGMGLVDEGDHYHSFSLTGGCTTQGV